MSRYSEFEEWKAKAKILGIYDDFVFTYDVISPLDMKYFDNNKYGEYYNCRINILKEYKGKSKTVCIPPVDKIADHAFVECKTIEKVIIHKNVRTIDVHAFHDCYNLKTVNIQAPLLSISSSCFFGCRNLIDINIPDTVEKIHMNAFTYCEKLRTLKLPEGLRSIGTGAFAHCGIEKMVIPESTYLLGTNMLNFCENLTELEILSIEIDSLNGLDLNGYIISHGCNNLKNVKVRYYLANSVAKHINKKDINIVEFGYSNK